MGMDIGFLIVNVGLKNMVAIHKANLYIAERSLLPFSRGGYVAD